MKDTFIISDNAQHQIKALNEKEGRPRVFRIQIKGGGCSGFQYIFSFEAEKKPDDLIFGEEQGTVVIDPVSFGFLKGACLEFVEDMVGSYFTISNPNATSGCGCGSSFAL